MSALNEAVSVVARQATEKQIVLSVANPNYPLAEYAAKFNADNIENKVAITDELLVSTEEHFEEINQEPAPVLEEQSEIIKKNLTQGVAAILFNTRNVIVPAIKQMVEVYNERMDAALVPEIEADYFDYDVIYSDVRLTSHLQRYERVEQLPEYRTFLIPEPSVERMIQMVSEDNPHLDVDQVMHWALSIPVDTFSEVWNSLFKGKTMLDPSRDLSYLSSRLAPMNIDSITFAYFLCGHLAGHPIDVQGETVELSEWENALSKLHHLFGLYLLRALGQRADNSRAGRVFFAIDSVNPIKDRRIKVILNRDVVEPWLQQGNDIQAILGASLKGNLVTLSQIDPIKDKLINLWLETYDLMRQASASEAVRCGRDSMLNAFVEIANKNENFKGFGIADLKARVSELMRGISSDELNDPGRSFGYLVCKVYYPDQVYYDFLKAMDECRELYPEATGREMATQAKITVIAMWLANQIKTQGFIPVVDPNARIEENPEPKVQEIQGQVVDAVQGEGPYAEERDEVNDESTDA